MSQNSWIDYEHVHFTFDWNWIKDKNLKLIGDRYSGMLIIYERDGRVVKMLGYELVSE